MLGPFPILSVLSMALYTLLGILLLRRFGKEV